MERNVITMVVARNLKALIEARQTNASDLARRAGLNPTGVYDILSGKSRSPKIETLGKIAGALAVPISLLFEEASDADLRSEIVSVFSRLSPRERDRLLVVARTWASDDESA